MSNVDAILLDTRSIQKYVFSCNKLKANIGASYIVDAIFEELMVDILGNLSLNMPKENMYWKNRTIDKLYMEIDQSIECEIAYIGGGNMLILIRKDGEDGKNICREIVKEWTTKLLELAPGLQTGAAIGKIDLDNDKFQASLSLMYKQLKENQNNILPQVNPPNSGMNIECDISGETATCHKALGSEEKRWYSEEVKSKFAAFEYARERIHKDYEDVLGEEYDFANQFEDLGYKDGESYISIIHIDGNNMGVKFSACETMHERSKLSLRVAEIVKESFREVLSEMVDSYVEYSEFLDLTDDGMYNLLPIRPIIIGGDDVTFVCPGRLGISLAKRFIEIVSEKELMSEEEAKKMEAYLAAKGTPSVIKPNMSCCGGIAIIPAKYPFFRAYQLAEQLCSVAKEKSRAYDNNLIEYAILHGEIYPTVEQLRDNQYYGVEGYLHYGPYFVGNVSDGEGKDKDHINDLIELSEIMKTGLKISSKEHAMANTKIKKLREVLTQDKHTIEIYWALSDNLRKIVANQINQDKAEADDLWTIDKNKNKKTRYIDAIEIMDFMPIKEMESRA